MSEMTATRMPGAPRRPATLVRAGAWLVAVGLWLLAASLLWRTSVPDLRLPELDPRDYLSRDALDRAARFDGFLRWEWVAATAAELLALVGLVFVGPRIARAFDLGRVGQGVMTGLVAAVVLWTVTFPFALVEHWWSRRYGLALDGYGLWLLETAATLSGEVVGITILLTILMLLAGWLPTRWWLVAAPVFVAIGAVFTLAYALLAPVGTRPVADDALAADIRELAREQGVAGTKVRVEEVSDWTPAINAEAVGLGPVDVVLLWDTLLRLDDDAVKVVTAHEFAHIAKEHVAKGLGWSALIAFPFLLFVALATRWRGGVARPEAVPVTLLALALAGLLVAPFGNAISRRYEAEADWVALQTTRDPEAARELFTKFVTLDLVQPRPPGWSQALLGSHPTVADRLAMVEAWERREGR